MLWTVGLLVLHMSVLSNRQVDQSVTLNVEGVLLHVRTMRAVEKLLAWLLQVAHCCRAAATGMRWHAG